MINLTRSEEIAWASGILEGEGSFVCYKIPNRADSYRVSVSISMTDKDVLDTFCKFIQVGKVKGPYIQKNRKDRYTWEVQNFSDCLRVAEMVYPLMHSRRKLKAKELIDLCTKRIIKETSIE